MATNLYNLFKPVTFLVHNAHFWLWHRCFLQVSPKPSSFGCIFPLWHRCFPLDFTGALFLVPSREPGPIACFCKNLMLNISFGCCRHSVSNTSVQLTEGRSARDQPKQPPAKKSVVFHADAKSNLAILHNHDMTNLFRASNWVSSSRDSIVSRGVTTCAGMTAHTVLLAQTRVGFLTGSHKKYFLALPENEQMEAYARATVAITRARALCSTS